MAGMWSKCGYISQHRSVSPPPCIYTPLLKVAPPLSVCTPYVSHGIMYTSRSKYVTPEEQPCHTLKQQPVCLHMAWHTVGDTSTTARLHISNHVPRLLLQPEINAQKHFRIHFRWRKEPGGEASTFQQPA